jgi:hypothetical protein
MLDTPELRFSGFPENPFYASSFLHLDTVIQIVEGPD